MNCDKCGGGTKTTRESPAGDVGKRRHRKCQACSHEFQTLEVRVDATLGRDSARRQACEALGQPFEPSKNLHTLRMEDHAMSREFLRVLREVPLCTVPNVARATKLSQHQVTRRFRYLASEGLIELVGRTTPYGPIAYKVNA